MKASQWLLMLLGAFGLAKGIDNNNAIAPNANDTNNNDTNLVIPPDILDLETRNLLVENQSLVFSPPVPPVNCIDHITLINGRSGVPEAMVGLQTTVDKFSCQVIPSDLLIAAASVYIGVKNSKGEEIEPIFFTMLDSELSPAGGTLNIDFSNNQLNYTVTNLNNPQISRKKTVNIPAENMFTGNISLATYGVGELKNITGCVISEVDATKRPTTVNKPTPFFPINTKAPTIFDGANTTGGGNQTSAGNSDAAMAFQITIIGSISVLIMAAMTKFLLDRRSITKIKPNNPRNQIGPSQV